MREAKEHGAKVLGIVNVVGSTIAREAHGGIYLHAGPEIGVASTKAFTSQVVALTLFTVRMGRLRGTLTAEQGREILHALLELPDKVEQVLELNDAIRELAGSTRARQNFLYLGRGYNFPTALEGALKLKEISYIHAEGLPAAEMKHGPIALIDENMPVVVIAPHDAVYQKVLSNIQEVKARGGRVIAVATTGKLRAARHGGPHDPGAGHHRHADAHPDDDPAAAAGLPRRGHARLQRGHAAEPGQERDGRIALLEVRGAQRRCAAAGVSPATITHASHPVSPRRSPHRWPVSAPSVGLRAAGGLQPQR
jgi:hypothetical protein